MFYDDITAPTPKKCNRFPQCPGGGRGRQVAFRLDDADVPALFAESSRGAEASSASSSSSVTTGIVIFFVVVLLFALFFWAPWRGAQSPAVQLLQKHRAARADADEEGAHDEPRFLGTARNTTARFHHLADSLR